MSLPFRCVVFTYLGINLFLIMRYGYIAATESSGPRRSKAQLIATITLLLSFIVIPLLQRFYESHLPIYLFSGTISNVDVRDSDSRHYSAYIEVALAEGGSVLVHVSDRNEDWRLGQRLRVRYLGDTGELIDATFLDTKGNEAGQARRTAPFVEALAALVGACLIWASVRRYGRQNSGASSEPEETVES